MTNALAYLPNTDEHTSFNYPTLKIHKKVFDLLLKSLSQVSATHVLPNRLWQCHFTKFLSIEASSGSNIERLFTAVSYK
jgi:hypothetical protein